MSIALTNRVKKLEKQVAELYEHMQKLESQRLAEQPMRRAPRVAPPGEGNLRRSAAQSEREPRASGSHNGETRA